MLRNRNANGSVTGIFSEVDSSLILDECPNHPFRINRRGEELWLYHPCIEACIGKYVMLQPPRFIDRDCEHSFTGQRPYSCYHK